MPSIDPLSTPRRLGSLFAVLLIVSLPWLVVIAASPSVSTLLTRRELKIGDVATAAGTDVAIHAMVGDVLRPADARNDLGFDLAAVTLYFDPLQTPSSDVLISNPLLASALSQAARDSNQFNDFVRNLLSALYQSREAIACFQRGEARSDCRGDKIVPYIWGTYNSGAMGAIQGVKYLGALPLFDPLVVTGAHSEADFRRRLTSNLDVAVRRLLNVASDTLKRSLTSVGFAALGSTSHRGGDSPAFLQFAEGFATIVGAVEGSRPVGSLDRVYLVAYNRHEGIFLKEAVSALRSTAVMLNVRRVTTGALAYLIGVGISGLMICLAALLYQNAPRIIGNTSRWSFVNTVSALSASLGAVTWGLSWALTELIPRHKPYLVLLSYSVMALIACFFVAWLCKRRIPDEKPKWLRTLRSSGRAA